MAARARRASRPRPPSRAPTTAGADTDAILASEGLDAAARRAGEKGVKNTLVLIEGRAFIVNVPSGTVITAMNNGDLKENVFTQIDGAVIV